MKTVADLLKTNPIALAVLILITWSVGLAATPYGATGNLCQASSGIDVKEFTGKSVSIWIIAMIIFGTIIVDIMALVF